MLADIQKDCEGIENEFEHKAMLYIGSESYDAPTITFLRGVHMLGFKVYTIGKPNINSWNVNTVLLAGMTVLPRFDFVLSNLHWGTRWSHYDRYGLHTSPKVLIDGDDNPWCVAWREKYDKYLRRYSNIEESQKDKAFMPRRWIEPLGSYEPDIVFASQHSRQEHHGLPFGIMPEYTEMASWRERDLFFRHVTGAGPYRQDTHEKLTGHVWHHIPSISILSSGQVRGDRTWPEWVPQKGRTEQNIHSWHRWSMNESYYRALSSTHVLIYPGVYECSWESKRPWEALACGCILMMRRPPASDYPLDELAPDSVLTYCSSSELPGKCEELLSREKELNTLQRHVMHIAHTYFTPEPIARHALRLIKEKL